MPYLWLVYLSFFFIRYFYVTPGSLEIALAAVSLVAFLALYFNAWWKRGPTLLLNIGGMTLLGLAWAPLNPGANVFFIFAGSFAAWLGPPRQAFAAIAVIVGLGMASAAVFQPSVVFWLPALVFTPLVGLVNIYHAQQARSDAALHLRQEEVRKLAQVAERERISRDLHDLLGHTLSVVALKAELAERLIERDPERARKEVAEVNRVARDSLAQVREAVSGMHSLGLAGELENARLALEAAGVESSITGIPPDLAAAREAALALVLREAVTNIVRHAGAYRCGIRFTTENDEDVMEITDDGRGAASLTGTGIDGMRARIASVGGRLELSTGSGLRVRARLPRREQLT